MTDREGMDTAANPSRIIPRPTAAFCDDVPQPATGPTECPGYTPRDAPGSIGQDAPK